MATTNTPKPDLTHEEALFHARLRPNHSLAQKGQALVLLFVGLVGIAVSVPFFLLGAWPVLGFFGLDVLALYLAFRLNSRRARAYEDILLTRAALLLRKVSHRGQVHDWRFNPYWVRLQRDEHEEFGLQRLALREGRRSVTIGGFLGAEEKGEIACALHAALVCARSGGAGKAQA